MYVSKHRHGFQKPNLAFQADFFKFVKGLGIHDFLKRELDSVETKTIEYLKLNFNFIYEPREDLCCQLIANYLGVHKITPFTSTKIEVYRMFDKGDQGEELSKGSRTTMVGGKWRISDTKKNLLQRAVSTVICLYTLNSSK